jgi:hypothetical protein
MGEKDEHLYWRIHLQNGEVWLCKNFGRVEKVLAECDGCIWEEPKFEYAMIGAVLEENLEVTNVPPAPFVIVGSLSVSAVEKLSIPRLSGYHRSLENHMGKFA